MENSVFNCNHRAGTDLSKNFVWVQTLTTLLFSEYFVTLNDCSCIKTAVLHLNPSAVSHQHRSCSLSCVVSVCGWCCNNFCDLGVKKHSITRPPLTMAWLLLIAYAESFILGLYILSGSQQKLSSTADSRGAKDFWWNPENFDRNLVRKEYTLMGQNPQWVHWGWDSTHLYP